MTQLSPDALRLVDAARTKAPGLEPEVRERVKRAALGLAVPAAAAASAAGASKSLAGLSAAVHTKLLVGAAVVAVGAGLSVGAVQLASSNDAELERTGGAASARAAPVPDSEPTPSSVASAEPVALPNLGPTVPTETVPSQSESAAPSLAPPAPSEAVPARSESAAPPAPFETMPARSESAAPSLAPPAPSEAVPAPSESAASSAAPADAPVAPQSSPAGTATNSLHDELLLTSSAMAYLEAREWSEALAQLDAYETRFPAGELSAEARTLKVLVLCGLERTTDARALADVLRHEAPGAPALRRLDDSCAAR